MPNNPLDVALAMPIIITFGRKCEKERIERTIVRPGAFQDAAKTGNYKHGFSATEKKLKLKISRADIADFLIRELQANMYLLKSPGLSY